MSMREEGHLGGYVIGGDPATYYPDLWRWLARIHGVRSVLDVGCGEGHAVQFFLDEGVNAVGVDGVPQPHFPRIVTCDYTQETGWKPKDARLQRDANFDLVWSCEFVEHVEERFLPRFMEHMTLAPLVLLTHAEPGQPGWHHVNCRPAAYWVGAMAANGYRLDDEMTADTRALAAANPDPSNHYARSGLAFRRYER